MTESRIFGSGPMADSIRDLEEQERRRINEHAEDCFAPYKCQSCGCDRQRTLACVSHQGNPMHMAAIGQRQAAAMERIAAQLEDAAHRERMKRMVER